jgi:hypothetical protein
MISVNSRSLILQVAFFSLLLFSFCATKANSTDYLDSADLVRMEWLSSGYSQKHPEKTVKNLTIEALRKLPPTFESLAVIKQRVALEGHAGQLNLFVRAFLAQSRSSPGIPDRMIAEQINIFCERVMFFAEKQSKEPKYYSDSGWLAYRLAREQMKGRKLTDVELFMNLEMFGPARSINVNWDKMGQNFEELSLPNRIFFLFRLVNDGRYVSDVPEGKSRKALIDKCFPIAEKSAVGRPSIAVIKMLYLIKKGEVAAAKKVAASFRTNPEIHIKYRKGMVAILEGKGTRQFLDAFKGAIIAPYPKD